MILRMARGRPQARPSWHRSCLECQSCRERASKIPTSHMPCVGPLLVSARPPGCISVTHTPPPGSGRLGRQYGLLTVSSVTGCPLTIVVTPVLVNCPDLVIDLAKLVIHFCGVAHGVGIVWPQERFCSVRRCTRRQPLTSNLKQLDRYHESGIQRRGQWVVQDGSSLLGLEMGWRGERQGEMVVERHSVISTVHLDETHSYVSLTS